MHPTTPATIPDLVPLILAVTGALFVICAIIMARKPPEHGRAGVVDALVPFAIPLGVTGLTVFIITAIGSVLLLLGASGFNVGQEQVTLAVPGALAMSLVILVVGAALGGNGPSPESRSGRPRH